MSDDLISRKAVLDIIKKHECDTSRIMGGVIELKTAYDVDKVVEQLKENEEDVIKAIRENAESEFSLIKVMDLEKLFEEYTQEQIEIVKSGGVAK